ncbi:peptide chain release factor N(5)-glutamine methyltransferase [Thiohalophilus sp.]|uniref:peptide chain release factor N(5)-glutamine methyltransferase n=1 Tax=Thiohalophilus sp. TaxID=3028392 RepID=UPI002ACE2FFA|nr:peptide chain release factor N(5)-glutamine methyltransferase [Thiohalophilus sp.]MDZ7662042.1 peptide chain release factor N(5)-glutamine methyltransferase [Thiohalophilus sp.]
MSLTVSELLDDAYRRLQAVSDSARLDSELLLAHVLQQSRTWLHTWPEKPIHASQQQIFDALLQRRLAGEPIAHILGEQDFWSLRLRVSPATLIPRPDTERLVELALERIPAEADWTVADLGTGCGAIALALAAERPRCHIIATEQSAEALDVARANVARHRLNNVQFIHGDWLSDLPASQRFEMIVSNPPYVREADPHLSRGDVRYEPRNALAAGADGLAAIRLIISQSWSHLMPGGWLLLEHGYDQGEAVQALLREAGYREVADFIDYGGNPRVAVGQRPAA